MKVTKSQRKKRIIDYIRKNPLCTKDAIFTKGKIAKSSTTIDLLAVLVSEGKVRITRTEKGKARYHTNPKEWNFDLQWKHRNLQVRELRFKCNDTAKKIPKYSPILAKYGRLLETRMMVLDFEKRYASKFGEIFNEEGLLEVTQRFEEFIGKIRIDASPDMIKSENKWLDFQISNDVYYLTHEAKVTSIFKSKKENELIRKYTRRGLSQPWKRRNRAYQKVKVARLKRTLYDMIGISKDRQEYGITRPNQIYHEQRLKKQDQVGTIHEFDEMFKRLNAEHHRIIYKNPDTMANQIMIMVCEKRLEIMKADHSKSKGYRNETKIMKDTIKQLKDNPTLLEDLDKKKRG